MAYNLRRAFLLSHKSTTDELIRLADSNEWARIACTSPEEAASKQHLVNNLLYALARYYPDRAYVRKVVRTKVAWSDDTDPKQGMVLWVGVPPANVTLRGSRPIDLTIVKPVTRSSAYVIEEQITEDNWSRIGIGMLAAAANPLVEEITFLIPPEDEGIIFIGEQLAQHGFEVEATKPHFRLRKATASATSALEILKAMPK